MTKSATSLNKPKTARAPKPEVVDIVSSWSPLTWAISHGWVLVCDAVPQAGPHQFDMSVTMGLVVNANLPGSFIRGSSNDDDDPDDVYARFGVPAASLDVVAGDRILFCDAGRSTFFRVQPGYALVRIEQVLARIA